MKYNSLNEIKVDFDLESNDIENIKEELEKQRLEIHPDRTGGEFPSDEIKDNYHKINDALTFIKNMNSDQSIIVIEKMTDLIKIVTDLVPNSVANTLENTLNTNIANSISRYHSRFILPKITLTGATSILSFLLLFPKQISENPLLSHYIDPTHSFFAIIWLVALIYCSAFWIFVFNSEEKAKRILSNLKVEYNQNEIFQEFLYLQQALEHKEIRKDELIRFIYKYYRSERISILYLLFKISNSEIVTMEVAQNITDLIIQRAIKNGILSKVTNYSLSETYKINEIS